MIDPQDTAVFLSRKRKTGDRQSTTRQAAVSTCTLRMLPSLEIRPTPGDSANDSMQAACAQTGAAGIGPRTNANRSASQAQPACPRTRQTSTCRRLSDRGFAGLVRLATWRPRPSMILAGELHLLGVRRRHRRAPPTGVFGRPGRWPHAVPSPRSAVIAAGSKHRPHHLVAEQRSAVRFMCRRPRMRAGSALQAEHRLHEQRRLHQPCSSK